MACFSTPYESFRDQVEQWDYDAMRRADYEEEQMHLYAAEAREKLGEHAKIIAEARMYGVESAELLFDKYGFNHLHSYALQEDLISFTLALDHEMELSIEADDD